MAPANIRRWPRHQVKLPVRIITANDSSEIAVPGLTTELSQGGMALYGGVALQPGDLMQVEFETSNRLRVAASIRDRNGYCFGLEFLGLLPNDTEENPESNFAEMNHEAGDFTACGSLVESENTFSIQWAELNPPEAEILALFVNRHRAYLQQKELEIHRLRQEIQEVRQSRREIELLILRQVLGKSG